MALTMRCGGRSSGCWTRKDVLTDPVQCRAYECDGLTGYRVVPRAGAAAPRRRAGGRGGAGLRRARGAVRGPRRRHRALRRRAAGRRRRGDQPGPAASGCWRSTRSTGGRSSSRASRTWRSPPRPRRTGSTTRPTRPASRSARSAATSRRTPAARTASSTASPPTTCCRSRSCCPTARSSPSAATPASRPGPTCAGCSSARRARSASPRRSPSGCCAPRSRCARCWPTSRRSRAAGDVVSDIVAAGIVPAAVEMMDTLAIEAAEEAVHAGYTVGVPAALVVELDGPAEECDTQFEQVKEICDAARLHPAAHRRLRRGARGDLAGPQGRVRRRRPDLARLLRAGRRGAPHPAGRGAGPDRRAWATRPGCGWRTSSTPATATCTRWCSTAPRPGETERGRAALRRDRRAVRRAGRVAVRRARHRHRQGVLDAEDVRRGRPRRRWHRVRVGVRPGRAVQPGQGAAHAAAVRRAARPVPAAPAGGGGGDRAA